MSDSPQQTPNAEKPNTITAMVIAKLEVLAEQSQRTEDAATAMAGQLVRLTKAVTANTDQLMLLTTAVQKLEASQDDLEGALGGLKSGMRNTNQRLRAVEGGANADGGIDP